MKTVFLSLFIAFSMFTTLLKSQTNNKNKVEISFSSTHTIEEQKINVDFFREFFGTNQCSYDNHSNSYKILTIHNYNIPELTAKIEGNSSFNNFNINITKLDNPTNNSDQ